MTVSFIVPTVGRMSLLRTLASIECWPGDEILLVSERTGGFEHDPRIRHLACPPGKDWGSTERNFAMPYAKGNYLAFLDDDDVYTSGTRELMADAMTRTPGRPVLFRMRFPNGITLWEDPVLRCGNMGTPTILVPNEPDQLGIWGPLVGGDTEFMLTMGWPQSAIVWRPEVIAHLGHNV